MCNQKNCLTFSITILILTIMSCQRIDIISPFLTDGIPPFVVYVIPDIGDKGVALNTSIRIRFSEPMETTGVQNGVTLTPSVPYNYNWSSDSSELTLIPTTQILPGIYYQKATVYTLTIGTTARDKNGINIENVYSSTFTTRAEPVLRAGDNYCLALSYDGKVSGWGDNYPGQLGNGGTDMSMAAVNPQGIENIRDISVGAFGLHSIAIVSGTSGSSVFTWGKNSSYQLGLGTGSNANSSTPQPVYNSPDILKQVISIGGGYIHTLAANTDGEVFSWGYNTYNQLGINNAVLAYVDKPTLITSISNVAKVKSGHSFSGALTKNNELYLWGSNSRGQLGVSTTGGNTEESYYTPQKRIEFTKVLDFDCGNLHTMAIIDNAGSSVLYSWGDNARGQLGRTVSGTFAYTPGIVTVTGKTFIKAVAGYNCSFAISSDHILYAWGHTQYYKLGITGININDITVVTTPTIILYDVLEVAAGKEHAIAVKTDGSIYTWGKNDRYQLGRETTDTWNTVKVGILPVKVAGINLNSN